MRDKRQRLLSEARSLLDTAEAENRDLTKEEDARFSAMHEEGDRLLRLAERTAEQESRERRELEREERQRLEANRLQSRETPEGKAKAYKRAFSRFMRTGVASLNHEDRAALESGFSPLDDAQSDILAAEMRVLGTDATGTPYGGYSIPEDFQNDIETAMAKFNGMLRTRAGAAAFTTSTGAALPWPTANDTANKGELLAEGNAASEQDVVMGRTVFDAFTYSSKMVKVQRQLLQDSAFDLGGYLGGLFGERLGRITSEHFFTGSGASRPRGITIDAVDSGITFSIGSSGLSTMPGAYDSLVDVQHSVEESYRADAEWLLHDDALKAIRKLKDADNNPIWNAGVAGKESPTILGNPYQTDPEMPDVGTATNRAIIFGDMSKYKIRRVKEMQVLRLEERYAEYLQVAFLAFLRVDGRLLDAGQNPVKYAAMVA